MAARLGWWRHVYLSSAQTWHGAFRGALEVYAELSDLPSGVSGFYHSIIEKGVLRDDSVQMEGMEGLHRIGKSADCLYYMFKNFSVTEQRQNRLDSIRRCADAFVKLFERYGTFGRFVNVESGDMIVGGTTSAAIGAAGLAIMEADVQCVSFHYLFIYTASESLSKGFGFCTLLQV